MKKLTKSNRVTICVYMDDQRVFQYEVQGAAKAREHVSAIVARGYVHNDGAGEFEHYPPHRISKVKATGIPIATRYPDRVTGT